MLDLLFSKASEWRGKAMLLKPGDFETDSTRIHRLGWSRKTGLSLLFPQGGFIFSYFSSLWFIPLFFCVHSVIASITSLVKDIWETLVGVLLVLLVNSCGQLWGEMTEGFVCPSHDQIDLSIVIGWWIVPYKTFWWLCFRAAAVQHKKAIRLGR